MSARRALAKIGWQALRELATAAASSAGANLGDRLVRPRRDRDVKPDKDDQP